MSLIMATHTSHCTTNYLDCSKEKQLYNLSQGQDFASRAHRASCFKVEDPRWNGPLKKQGNKAPLALQPFNIHM